MKKSILMTIVMVIVLSIASMVNAATATVSISGDVSQVKTGDEVTITVKSTETVKAANFKLKYNKNFLKFIESDTSTENDTYADGTNFNYFNTKGTKEFHIKFKVVGTEGSTTVTAEPTTFAAGTTEEDDLGVTAISGAWKVEIIKEQPKNEVKENTVAENEVKENVVEENTVTENVVEENTVAENEVKENTVTEVKAPTRYPQTGFNVAPVIAVGAIAVIVSTVAIRRRINK